MPIFLDLINEIVRYPGMFISGKTYGEFVALIYGFDAALKNEPLEGFREWLVLKYNGGNNLTWSTLILCLLKIDLPSFVSGPTELHMRAIEGLA